MWGESNTSAAVDKKDYCFGSSKAYTCGIIGGVSRLWWYTSGMGWCDNDKWNPQDYVPKPMTISATPYSLPCVEIRQHKSKIVIEMFFCNPIYNSVYINSGFVFSIHNAKL